jgi:hypothetical protein
MKYKGSIEYLHKLGYQWNEGFKCYEKRYKQSGVFIFLATKVIEYYGRDSKVLLDELGGYAR